MNRETLVKVHRWAGLFMAFFLIIAAATGSLLAFFYDLDRFFASELYRTQSQLPLRDALTLWQPVLAFVESHGGTVRGLPLDIREGQSLSYFVQGISGIDQIFQDPHSGEITGTRHLADLTEGLQNLMPFIYYLHYNLALPGKIGGYLLGLVALLWTIDCLVSLILTLPRPQKHSSRLTPSKPFMKRWWPAFLVKWQASGIRFHFDLHRAAGLWLWLVLLIFAWSSVGFNLPAIYSPVMKTLFDARNPFSTLQGCCEPIPKQDVMVWHEALANARQNSKIIADKEKITINGEYRIQYIKSMNFYRYRVYSDRDIQDRYGSTQFFFHGQTGELLEYSLPSGQYAGNTIHNWLVALHLGSVFGLPYRIFIALLGGMICYLTYSGLLIWWRKRKTRKSVFRGIAKNSKAQTE